MSENLITLPQAALLVGRTSASLRWQVKNYADTFPEPVSYKGNNPLYRRADILAWKAQQGISHKGLDNEMARAFLTGQYQEVHHVN